MIKGIIFDLGKVLLLYPDDTLYEKFAKEYGVEPDLIRNLMHQYWHGGWVAEFESIKHFYELKSPSKEFDADALQSVLDEMKTGSRIDPEMLQLAKNLKAKGYKLGLLTNFTGELAEWSQGFGDLFSVFETVVHSYAVRLKKPDPKIYERMLERMQLQPEEVVFIDDNPKYAKGAQAIGIESILYQNPQQCRQELEKLLKRS